MKKRGFGVGRWNGFGGKVSENESIEQAALREIEEECKIIPTNLESVGILEYHYQNSEEVLEVHVFKATNFSGTPTETEEMNPKWFDLNKIPYPEMWADDIYWIPLMLQNKKFKGYFELNEKDEILQYQLAEIV